MKCCKHVACNSPYDIVHRARTESCCFMAPHPFNKFKGQTNCEAKNCMNNLNFCV